MKSRTPSASSVTLESFQPSLDACLAALTAHLDAPESVEKTQALHSARLEVARTAAAHCGQSTEASVARLIAELQLKLAAARVLDYEVAATDIALATELSSRGVVGLLAAMTVVPAWQWPAAPALSAVPEALWSPYTAWLFHAPQNFSTIGEAESYAAHTLRRLEELDHLVSSRRSSPAVREALTIFASTSNGIPLCLGRDSLRRHMELRGRLLTVWGAADRNAAPAMRSRAGRRLRVGFVSRDFNSGPGTCATLPMFEELDATRFEVQLFAHHNGDTNLEKYARGCAAGFTLLPEKLEEQLINLRAADLDVAVFCTNVTAVCNEVTRLALHRIAPLQVVNNFSCTTTGLPEIDLFLSGTMTGVADAPEHFTERLALAQDPAHAFNHETDRQTPARTWTRADIGLTEKTMLFVSAANFSKITPELRELWVRLLAAVPGARLLLHPFRTEKSPKHVIQRFCAEFDRVLGAHGVASERLIVSSVRFPSRTDVGELLKLGDVYLDAHPYAGASSLVDPLEQGLPVVTCEGGTLRSRTGAALLRSLGLDELVVQDDEAYLALCSELAYEPAARAELRSRISAAMERAPLFLDRLAASDAFGALMEQAYDELCAKGREAFRREAKPLVAPDVAAPALRHARGRALLAAGDAIRASDYLLAAIQQDEKNAALWRDLADALRRANRVSEAVHCLQTCLQLDPCGVEAWHLLADLARSLGHAELRAEAGAMIAKLSEPAPAALSA